MSEESAELLSRWTRRLKRGAELSLQKIEEAARVGRLQIEIHRLGRERDRRLGELGRAAHEAWKQGRGGEFWERTEVLAMLQGADEAATRAAELQSRIEGGAKPGPEGAPVSAGEGI